MYSPHLPNRVRQDRILTCWLLNHSSKHGSAHRIGQLRPKISHTQYMLTAYKTCTGQIILLMVHWAYLTLLPVARLHHSSFNVIMPNLARSVRHCDGYHMYSALLILRNLCAKNGTVRWTVESLHSCKIFNRRTSDVRAICSTFCEVAVSFERLGRFIPGFGDKVNFGTMKWNNVITSTQQNPGFVFHFVPWDVLRLLIGKVHHMQSKSICASN